MLDGNKDLVDVVRVRKEVIYNEAKGASQLPDGPKTVNNTVVMTTTDAIDMIKKKTGNEDE